MTQEGTVRYEGVMGLPNPKKESHANKPKDYLEEQAVDNAAPST
jgi:hypothetical protein